MFDLSLKAIRKVDGIEQLARSISEKQDAQALLNDWSKTYFQFIHARHNTLAQGGGAWNPLSRRTIRDREQRSSRGGQPYRKTTTSILQDTLQLYEATRGSGGRGQVRNFDVERFTVALGISGAEPYNDPRKGMRTKAGRFKKHPAKRTLGQLARFHASTGRRIIVPPNKNTMDRIERTTRAWMGRLLKRAGL